MKGTKISIVAVFFAALLCANVFAEDFKAEVVSVTGKVDCMKGSQWTPVKTGDFLLRGDVIQTGFRSELVLKIEGSTVTVSPLTRMSVEMLNAQEDRDNTSLYVATGSVVSDVNKNNNRKVGFTVRAPVATASVRGTIILVKNTFRSCSFRTLRGNMDVIPNSNSDKFAIYNGSLAKYTDKARKGTRYVNTVLINENESSEWNQYIAFDIFLKNVSGSPKKDNLYIGRSTYIDFDESADEETREKMQDIFNTIRMGIVKIGETNLKADVNTIQNLQCNGECVSLIYEPNSTKHNQESIDAASELGISLSDNTYVPTYGVIAEGDHLNHKSGFINSGVELDTEHFALQHTIFESNFSDPIFQIPNGITKARVYVWIEGQDIDALEVHSEGAPVALNLDLEKDLAGYEEY